MLVRDNNIAYMRLIATAIIYAHNEIDNSQDDRAQPLIGSTLINELKDLIYNFIS